MLFGGMQKLTALDFPGVASALLFTQGCNFHCPYCHNAQLIPAGVSQTAVSENDVLAFLTKRAGLLDGVVITGGEPCLQRDLESFCRTVKGLGYKVKLDTNGSFPEITARLVAEELLDHVALDVKTAPENYAPHLAGEEDAGKRFVETCNLLAASSVPFEARTTCVFPFVDEAAVKTMAELVPSDVPWFFQRANVENPSATMYVLSEEEIRSLLGLLEKTHPLAQLRE